MSAPLPVGMIEWLGDYLSQQMSARQMSAFTAAWHAAIRATAGEDEAVRVALADELIRTALEEIVG